MTSQRRAWRTVAPRPWAISLAALVALLAGADSARAARPWLHEFAPAEQREFGRRILGYLTDEELHWHMNIDHDEPGGFFHGHRAYLARLEGHLARTGGGRFVPLPKWDPGRPIPDGLRGVRPGYRPLERHSVGMPVPTAFRGPALARYGDLASLFAAVRSYHDAVHERVGGCMADAMTAPAAAVFFCWHATLDDLFGEWAWRTGCRIADPSRGEFPGRVGHASGRGGHGDGDIRKGEAFEPGTGEASRRSAGQFAATRRRFGPHLSLRPEPRLPPVRPPDAARGVMSGPGGLFVEADGPPPPFGWDADHGVPPYHDGPYHDGLHHGGPYDDGYRRGAQPWDAGFDGPNDFAGPEPWGRPSYDDPSWDDHGLDPSPPVPDRPPAVFHLLP